MTRDEILALDGREFDAKMAEFLRWTPRMVTYKTFTAEKIQEKQRWWVAPDGCIYANLPSFSSDRNAAALVLAEVEGRGNEYAMVRALRVVEPSLPNVGLEYGEIQVWQVLRLTPKQLCQAALLAVEGV